MNLSDLSGIYVIRRNGVIHLPPEDTSLDGIADFLGGPIEEARTQISYRKVMFTPLGETFGLPVNQFASNLCRQRIHGDVVVMALDTFVFTDSP